MDPCCVTYPASYLGDFHEMQEAETGGASQQGECGEFRLPESAGAEDRRVYAIQEQSLLQNSAL